jgi:hypothetical protein
MKVKRKLVLNHIQMESNTNNPNITKEINTLSLIHLSNSSTRIGQTKSIGDILNDSGIIISNEKEY